MINTEIKTKKTKKQTKTYIVLLRLQIIEEYTCFTLWQNKEINNDTK